MATNASMNKCLTNNHCDESVIAHDVIVFLETENAEVLGFHQNGIAYPNLVSKLTNTNQTWLQLMISHFPLLIVVTSQHAIFV